MPVSGQEILVRLTFGADSMASKAEAWIFSQLSDSRAPFLILRWSEVTGPSTPFIRGTTEGHIDRCQKQRFPLSVDCYKFRMWIGFGFIIQGDFMKGKGQERSSTAITTERDSLNPYERTKTLPCWLLVSLVSGDQENGIPKPTPRKQAFESQPHPRHLIE